MSAWISAPGAERPIAMSYATNVRGIQRIDEGKLPREVSRGHTRRGDLRVIRMFSDFENWSKAWSVAQRTNAPFQFTLIVQNR